MKFAVFIFSFCLSTLFAAQPLILSSFSKDTVKKYAALYAKNQKRGKASLLLDPIYRKIKNKSPNCDENLLKDNLRTCNASACFHPMELSGTKMWQEVFISRRAEDTCLVSTPQRVYTVKKIRWSDFSTAFPEALSSDQLDDHTILREVAENGATKRTKQFVDAALKLKCEYELFYQFKLNKNNLRKSEKFKLDRDGLSTKKIGNTITELYTEAGETYQKIDPKRKVFFYSKVKFIEDAQANDQKACAKLVNLLPYVLEQMDQVEHLPPDEI